MITLRDYQQTSVEQTRGALRHYRSVLLQSPTGSGKTAMASYMLNNVQARQKRGFFICHRRELIDQTAKTFDKIGIDYGYIAAGMRYDHYKSIYICSIDTLKNRLGKVQAPDFCVWDEAHHVGAAGWSRVKSAYSSSFHVGLSATPQRLDGKGLDEQFDYLVPGPSVEWLIEQGYLAKYKLFSVPGADMTGVHTKMGDFVKSESAAVMDKPSITGDIIKHWRKLAADKLTIGFAVSVAHSQHIVAQFNAAGIPAAHLDGTTEKAERARVLKDFALGKIRVVFNVGLFAEGFDIAANSGIDVTVGCVIDAAPTQALGAWLQRCGRALRKQDGHAVILDHSGNALRHGMPCMDREWTLEGRKKGQRRSDNEETLPIRQCPECFCIHEPEPNCPACGYEYPVQARKVEEVDGELTELDPEAMKRQARKEQGSAQTYEDLVELGRKRNMKNPEGWARHVFNARQAKKFTQRGHL